MERPDQHQLIGLDDQQRGFSRPVIIEHVGKCYRAKIRYESLHLETNEQPTESAALEMLILTMQSHGYRNLRTQPTFRDGVYLGSQEVLVDYEDQPLESPRQGFFIRFFNWAGFKFTQRQSTL